MLGTIASRVRTSSVNGTAMMRPWRSPDANSFTPRRDGWPEMLESRHPAPQPGSAPTDRTVHLGGDGVGLTPRAYAALLNELAQRSDVAEATYLEAVLVRTAGGRVATEVGAILIESPIRRLPRSGR